MIGYKGFNKDFQCVPDGGKPYRFKVGETYHEDDISICYRGFHFCEHPLDVFGYYDPAASRFAEIEASGDIQKTGDKSCASTIHIIRELSLAEIIAIAVTKSDKIKHATGYRGAAFATGDSDAASATGHNGAASATGDSGAASATGYSGAASATGYRGAASATGDSGAASATGDRGAASATGYRGAASATGHNGAASATGYRGAASATGDRGIACSHGADGIASASLGNWIVLSEWGHRDGVHTRKTVKAVKVDGKRIKPNVFYTLKRGKFVVAK